MDEQVSKRIDHYHDHFNPVLAQEAVGAAFLGTLSLILLVAFLRQVRMNRQLIERIAALEARA
jgi:hypothetical protein